MNHTILQMLRDAQPSVFQKVASYTLPEDIPHGDMPGDKILIENAHIEKAQKLMAPLVDNLITTGMQTERKMRHQRVWWIRCRKIRDGITTSLVSRAIGTTLLCTLRRQLPLSHTCT